MVSLQVPVMDKAGRRPLLLYPMVGMIITLATITVSFNLQVHWLTLLLFSNVFHFAAKMHKRMFLVIREGTVGSDQSETAPLKGRSWFPLQNKIIPLK